ncbi:phosphatidylinositol phosphate synthase [Catenuloplanes atrovinosus]|uniref:Phosphatidylinositol phosphate synthase n=1 Tax=Catenuloplanes atrovinosus TaxID=137266 RepID=A0AAE3YKF0_9ACTN|nr:CDP-alcohol phosphatidyltransferase family protein [Catenuloplanes atrovinosus]MDR7274090.1 CDP-diacylglycerol--glycerol-3-phosphate 3-phosphatidyltransferase [Catenuloplanes atrovinosus]
MAKILSVSARAGMAHLIEPVSRALLRLGVTPNAVTVAGTIGVVVGAVVFGTRGHFIIGALFITVACLTDLIDGTMARLREGPNGRFGALLDSSMDRVADAAIFGSLVYWFGKEGDWVTATVALVCLVASVLVSYVKARAEGLGFDCNVGIVERAERLIGIGIGALSTAFGVLWGLQAVLWILAVLSIVTAWQRMRHVYKQDQAALRAQRQSTTA